MTPATAGSLREVNQMRVCKCGHVSGIHYGPTGVCKAESCPCIAFREFVPSGESSGFDPKPIGGHSYGKADQ